MSKVKEKAVIPLSVPVLGGEEWTYVKECIETGWVSSAGAYVTQFEAKVAEFVGSKHGIFCRVITSLGKSDNFCM